MISYNRFLATEADRRGLAFGFKNDLDTMPQLEAVFDAEYQQKYIDNRSSSRGELWSAAASRRGRFSTIVLPLLLDDTF